MQINNIIETIENIAPLETQEEWDNSGWQVNLGNKNAERIMLALDITEQTVTQAVKKGCDMIISHHPIFFKPIKCIKNKSVINAIKNNIQIYSIHTCFDKSPYGTTETLANKLEKSFNVSKAEQINEYVKLIK